MSHPAVMIGTGLVLGLGHAFDADHIAAMTAFIGPAPKLRAAASYAARWAAGHGFILLGVGALAIGFRVDPGRLGDWGDRIVGATLILIGLWSVRRAFRLHVHSHAHEDGTVHAHAHSHAGGPGHVHRHVPTVMGLLHGLAGSGAVVVAIPAALAASEALAALFLLCFGVGVAMSMLAYALGLAVLIRRRGAPSLGFQRTLSAAAGVANLLIGILWMSGLHG